MQGVFLYDFYVKVCTDFYIDTGNIKKASCILYMIYIFYCINILTIQNKYDIIKAWSIIKICNVID